MRQALSVASAFALGGAFVATPATAVTYDAFTSFNGTQGAGNFYYGEANASSPNTPGVFFAANTNCFIDGASCLQLLPDHDVPGFTKGGSPSFQYGSVNVPSDRLLAHPDNDSDLTFIAFVAPTAGQYLINAMFNIQDINPSGVDLFQITTTTGGLPLVFQQVGSLSGTSGPSSFYSFSQTVNLGASEAFGFGIGNGGNYSNDSVGVNFSASNAVPEPATWAMMLVGFGAIGWVMRRRRNTAQRINFAF
jgi:hypothetical protein